MKNFKSILQKSLPTIVAILVFGVVAIVGFAPQLEGKVLPQHDIRQFSGMSRDIRECRADFDEDPQWSGAMFSGMPAYQINIKYPAQIIKRTVDSVQSLFGGPAGMTFFAMVAAFVMAVLMGMSAWVGLIVGLAYGLSTYFFLIIDAGHITKMWALVYAPPLVGAVWCTLKRNMWAGAALAALFGSLELGANHPQITYYFLLVCLALWISELVKAWRRGVVKDIWSRTAILAVAAVVAVGSNLAPLWYTVEHQKHTTRVESEVVDAAKAREDKIAYNTAWSYGIAESCNMLVPNYMGSWSYDVNEGAAEIVQRRSVQNKIFDRALRGFTNMLIEEGVSQQDINYALESGDEAFYNDLDAIYKSYMRYLQENTCFNYWGKQPYTAGPTYLGAVAIFLALLALLLYGWRSTLWVVVVSLFALLLAWGANIMGFYEVMYDFLPGYSSFRTVSMALVVLEWSVPLLCACAIYRIVTQEIPSKILIRRTLIAYGIIVAAVLVMMFTADYGITDIYEYYGRELWVEQLCEAVREGRSAALMADAWRTIGFVTLSQAAIVGYALLRERKGKRWYHVALAVVLGVLVVWDLSGVAKRYITDDKWYAQKPTEHVATAADKAILADKDLGFRVLDFSAGDPFNSARASYFHRSVGGYHGAKLGRYQDVIDSYLKYDDSEVLAALNTRYVIMPNGKVNTLDSWIGVEPNGPAWFVSTTYKATSASDALDALGREFLYDCAIVEGVDVKEAYDCSGEIELVEYAPNYLKYEYDAPAEALAVFSEIYFPDGWTVKIDGKEADYFVADYILRGMELPAGKHTVEWSFRAPHWGLISTIMAVCSIVVVLFVVRALMMIMKSKK